MIDDNNLIFMCQLRDGHMHCNLIVKQKVFKAIFLCMYLLAQCYIN